MKKTITNALLFITSILLLNSCSSSFLSHRMYGNRFYVKAKKINDAPKKSEIRFEDEINQESVMTASIENQHVQEIQKYPASNNNVPVFTSTTNKNNVLEHYRQIITNEPCDLIVFKNGDEIEAKIIEISVTEIKYKKCNNLNGPTNIVSKSEVLFIKYPNGTKDVFSDKNVNTAPKDNSSSNKDIEILGLLAMIVGILGLLLGLFISGLFAIVFGLAAIVLAIISFSKFKNNPGKYMGKGFSIAGLVLGIFELLLIILLVGILFLLI